MRCPKIVWMTLSGSRRKCCIISCATHSIFSVSYTHLDVYKRQAYGNESYQIREDATREIIGEGQTDGGGHFTLAAGCTAIFEEVPAGVDYAITEEEQEGWRVVGDATQEGATQAPVTAIRYTNAIASFGVKKTVTQGEAGEDIFSFLLLKEDKKAFAGARYFLYDAQGNRVGEEVYETDEKGNFTLHAGQTALFIGIEPGTAYHVSETAQAGYIQKVPENAQGYENKIVAVQRYADCHLSKDKYRSARFQNYTFIQT